MQQLSTQQSSKVNPREASDLTSAGTKQPIDETGADNCVEQQNDPNSAQKCRIPRRFKHNKRRQQKERDDQSRDSFGFVLVGAKEFHSVVFDFL